MRSASAVIFHPPAACAASRSPQRSPLSSPPRAPPAPRPRTRRTARPPAPPRRARPAPRRRRPSPPRAPRRPRNRLSAARLPKICAGVPPYFLFSESQLVPRRTEHRPEPRSRPRTSPRRPPAPRPTSSAVPRPRHRHAKSAPHDPGHPSVVRPISPGTRPKHLPRPIGPRPPRPSPNHQCRPRSGHLVASHGHRWRDRPRASRELEISTTSPPISLGTGPKHLGHPIEPLPPPPRLSPTPKGAELRRLAPEPPRHRDVRDAPRELRRSSKPTPISLGTRSMHLPRPIEPPPPPPPPDPTRRWAGLHRQALKQAPPRHGPSLSLALRRSPHLPASPLLRSRAARTRARATTRSSCAAHRAPRPSSICAQVTT